MVDGQSLLFSARNGQIESKKRRGQKFTPAIILKKTPFAWPSLRVVSGKRESPHVHSTLRHSLGPIPRLQLLANHFHIRSHRGHALDAPARW
jgi:hypothetical protein